MSADPTLERDERGWWVANARDGTGRLVRVGPMGKGEATALYLRLVGILPPAPSPAGREGER